MYILDSVRLIICFHLTGYTVKSCSSLTLEDEDACILSKVASLFIVQYFGRIAVVLMYDGRLSRQKRGSSICCPKDRAYNYSGLRSADL